MDEIRLEIMFDDDIVTNGVLLDYKKPYLVKCHIGILQRGDPMNFVKIKKPLFVLVLDKIRLEIMFDDHLVKNRGLLDYKISLFGQEAIMVFFQREDPMNLVQT